MGQNLGQFHSRFEQLAAKVRRRLVMKQMITGLAGGLLVGVALAALAWWLRLGALRPLAALAGLIGAALGMAWALRRRWSDQDIALFLDARLSGDEVISTAVELRSHAERADIARELVVKNAAQKLSNADPKSIRPRLLFRHHAVAPLAAVLIVYLSSINLPALPPEPPPPPGAELIKQTELKGLEKIIQLEQLNAKDPEQQKRLKAIAEEAKKLREQLNQGVEKREALAKIAQLRDEINAEKLSLGNSENRPGLEAALNKLSERKETKDAAKALSQGDLTEFDKEMQRLANQAEDSARDAAKQALEEAAKAAREKGAKGLAEALEEQKKLFEERSQAADALRELAKELGNSLSPEGQQALKDFSELGDPEAQRRLAEALGEALEGLSESERKQLAENLKKQMEQNQGEDSASPEQLKEFAEALKDPLTKEELQEMLRELASPQPSEHSQREQGLGEADRGGSEAQRQLGAPIPVETPGGAPNQGNPGSGDKNPSAGNSPGSNNAGKMGGPGSERDEGTADHTGAGKKVDGDALRSKANARWNAGGQAHGATMGRSSGSLPGQTANQQGSGALGQVAPQEIGSMERSEVPEEYREQVGRYFQP